MAKGYKVVAKTKMPKRDEALLARPNPFNDHIVDPYDLPAPGLYPDERLLQLDADDFVAVSVETFFKANGEGVMLIGVARWIEEDGTTKLTPDGKHIERSYNFGFNQDWLDAYGANKLASEIIQLMLGEAPTIVQLPAIDKKKLATAIDGYPEGTVIDLNKTEQPILDVPKEMLDCVNIRIAISQAKLLGNVEISL